MKAVHFLKRSEGTVPIKECLSPKKLSRPQKNQWTVKLYLWYEV